MASAIEVKRLYKSRADKMIDGICGGFAEYLEVDSTLVRLAFVLLAFMGGFGVLLYFIAMIVMPVNPGQVSAAPVDSSRREPGNTGTFWGILLIVVGGLWFLTNVGFRLWSHWWHLPWGLAVPILLIFVGAYLLAQNSKGGINASVAAPQGSTASPGQPGVAARRLYRSRFDKKLFGVCGGVAAYFNIDPTFVRILFVVSALVSFGTMLLLYLIMAVVIPAEPVEATRPA
jgi:phage shock protein C